MASASSSDRPAAGTTSSADAPSRAATVWSLVLTPDGTHIVTGGGDATVRIWDLVTGNSVGDPLVGHTGDVYAVAITPDGTRLVTGGYDATVRIWDVATGNPVGDPLVGHTGDVYAVAITPDGTRLV
ncbi:WD40 repeat domain-containing protein, partial [Pseudonocardia sp. TRM90224]|uniref:WD40 repeat domain-containing protein n=1 Tax=Pseudonocardia sp. TRM90224 TaxID=2812678 RepID=UPI0035A83031